MKPIHLIFCLLFTTFCACEKVDLNKITGPSDTYHLGIQYKFDEKWEPCHNREIDISDQPNNFILEFRSFGITHARIPENSQIKLMILDTLWLNGKLNLKPMYDSKPDYFLQRIGIESNGESRIEFTCFFLGGDTDLILVRNNP